MAIPILTETEVRLEAALLEGALQEDLEDHLLGIQASKARHPPILGLRPMEVEVVVGVEVAAVEVEVGVAGDRPAIRRPANPHLAQQKKKNVRKRTKSTSNKCLLFLVFERGSLLFETKLLVPAAIHNEISLGSWKWRPLG